MFDQYTETARLTIFHARAEAGQVGSAFIGPEHLLLGLLHVYSFLSGRLPKDIDAVRREILGPAGKAIHPSLDLPLSSPAKEVLAHSGEESARLGDRQIRV